MMIVFNSRKFSEKVRMKRFIELRLDLRSTAKLIDISAATLSRIENEQMPDVITYAKVCDWLNCSTDEFIEFNKQSPV